MTWDDVARELTAAGAEMRLLKAAGVVAHVAGPSGSGKTTLMNDLAARHPGLVTKDMDEFDEQAEVDLGYAGTPKQQYTDDMLSTLAARRQQVMDDWLAVQGDKPVVLGGHHWEGEHVLDLPAGAAKALLPTSPLISAWRAYRRSQAEAPQFRRRLSELPADWAEARADVKRLKGMGYVAMSPAAIDGLVAEKTADLQPTISLQPHQERVRKKVQSQLDSTGRSRILLYHSLGSGKTLSGLAAADATGLPYTAVVPAALRENMRKEQERFLDPATAPAGDVMSQTALGAGKPVEKSRSLIVDEAHRLRNPETAQSRRLLGLAAKADQVTLLSGTPVVNDPGDFAVPYQVLTGKKMTPDEFYGRYVREEPTDPPWYRRLLGEKPEGPGVAHADELKRDLAGKIDYHAPTQPKAEVTREDVPVEMTPEQAKLYKGMYGQLPWMLRWKLERDYHMSKEELTRLTSFMTGPRQVGLSTLPFMRENKDPAAAFAQSPKLQAAFARLKAQLDANQNAKALIFSNFIEAGLTPYQAGLEAAGIPAAAFTGKLNDAQRKKLVDDYNANRIRVALLGPSGTEGLSFKGTRLIQLLDPHWNTVRGRQSEGRGLRFDSHDHLPPDQRKVLVQRFFAKLPPEGLGKAKRLLGLQAEPGRAADDYLALRAQRKEEVNQRFLDLLKEVGSR